MCGRIFRVPVSIKCGDLTAVEDPRSFRSRGRIALRIGSQDQDYAFLTGLVGYRSQFVLDRRAIRDLIVKPAEIAATYAISAKGFRQFGNCAAAEPRGPILYAWRAVHRSTERVINIVSSLRISRLNP
jgi:hypothetical protein